MVNSMIWAILGLLVFFGLIAIVVVKKGKKKPIDYYEFFVMGITWIPLGIIMMAINPDLTIGNIFFILGLIYLGIGLFHKKDWKKNHKSWKQLNNKERKLKTIILIILGLLVLVGLVAFYIAQKGFAGLMS